MGIVRMGDDRRINMYLKNINLKIAKENSQIKVM